MFTTIGRLIAWLPVLLTLASCGADGGNSSVPASGPSIAAYKLSGLNFGPHLDGQDPNVNPQVTIEQLRSQLQVVAPYTESVRSFGVTDGLEAIPAIARASGLKAYAGAWIGRDRLANDRQLASLITVGQSRGAEILIVGSEVLLRGDQTESELLAHIARVKSAVPGLPVAYADTYDVLLAHPRVIAAVDVLLANYYPYWQGVHVDDAVAAIHGSHARVLAAAQGKRVIVGETGWPSAGNMNGNAVPSEANAAAFFLNFVSWARATATEYCYFEAMDEQWKAKYEGPQGGHWGIWNSAGEMKPGMQQVFDGVTVADNWSVTTVPGGPETPALEFTNVPPYGSHADLSGRAWHVNPGEYKVAVYILVANGWWAKPTAAAPLTAISRSGLWTVGITTGGIDAQATRIAAFLVPNGYRPPILLGAPTIPDELMGRAVAKLEVARVPGSP